MSYARKQLLETLAGHFELLKSTHPRKAASPVAKRARNAVKLLLRPQQSRGH